MSIENTTPADLDFIFSLFDDSIVYQKKNGYISWEGYDKQALIRDVENKNQYKVIMNNTIAMAFSVCYSDKIIWREREKGDAVYLHRIVVNPQFKGQRLFGHVLTWTKEHARLKGLKFVRMDTWAVNSTIIDYYKTFGFTFLENFTTPDSAELPVHNRRLQIALLEIDLIPSSLP